jgi:DNA-binding beta-propeller fold protein YncE
MIKRLTSAAPSTRRLIAAAVAALLLCAVSAGPARAAAVPWPPELFTQIPSAVGGESKSGSAAGELDNSRSLAVNPENGHVYVVDGSNARISEFTAWGEFVKAWGWGVLNGNPQLQVCTGETGCQQGTEGSGAGQPSNAQGVALDSEGNVYLVEQANLRVEKFSPAGEFLLMFGGEVNKTTGEDVCTKAQLEGGDVCGIGVSGTGNGEFGTWVGAGSFIAIDADDTVFVGDENRIQKFDTNGIYQAQIPLPEAGLTKALTVDPAGDLYFAFDQSFTIEKPKRPTIYKLDPDTGAVLDELQGGFNKYLGTDSAGNLYALINLPEPERDEAIKFDSSGNRVAPGCCSIGESTSVTMRAVATSSACKVPADQLFTAYFGLGQSFVRGFGPLPDPAACPPPKVPPTVEDQYALSVGSDEASVRAQIHPHFWPDTTYYVQYGTGKCSAGGCEETAGFPGAKLGKGVGFSLRTASVFLTGLEPGTTYHYRFVSQSGGGGPVFGEEEALTTFALPSPPDEKCANGAFRSGASGALPDCRAHEMVSPLDKDNGDIAVLGNINSDPSSLNQSAVDGSGLTYSSYRAFDDPRSAPFTSQYLAARGASGWSTQGISPPRNGSLLSKGDGLDTQFRAFSPDLCGGWLLYDSQPPLDPTVPPGFASLYRRDNCGGGVYEGITPVAPPNLRPLDFTPELQGPSADGSHAIFRASDALTEDAPVLPADKPLLYESYGGGQLRYVCILPNGAPLNGPCSAGTPFAQLINRYGSVEHAISEDGGKIYWSAAALGPGKLYLRLFGEETLLVSAADAQFWTASADGSKALYSVGADLLAYDLGSESSSKLVGGFKGLLGASEDASRAYLVSTEVHDEGAVAGKPNLYLYEAGEEGGEGTFTFIGTLSAADAASLVNGTPSPLKVLPSLRLTRVTPDGGAVAFMSSASLTGYDNTDAASGKADAEVFHYDAASDSLACVSCNPSGARPSGRDLLKGSPEFWAAAQIPGWENQLYATRVLSGDGKRLFFESFDPLVLSDTNGAQDVYQWEAEGKGGCGEGDPAFRPASGGCVALISSGLSPARSDFLDAGASGDDVFFTTQQSLLSQDPGLVDIYDARVGGGFPTPPDPQPECEGEACQNPAPAPNDPTPSSAAFRGPGDPSRAKPRGRSCPQGKRRVRRAGKSRCLKPQRKPSHQRRTKR